MKQLTAQDLPVERLRPILEPTEEFRTKVREIREDLLRRAEITSDIQASGGEAWVRIRVRIGFFGPRWFNDKGAACATPSMLMHAVNMDYSCCFDELFHPSVPWRDRTEAVWGAVYSALMDDEQARASIASIEARIAKIFKKRSSQMAAKEIEQRAAFVRATMEDIGRKLAKICDSVSEEDVVALYREAVVGRAQES